MTWRLPLTLTYRQKPSSGQAPMLSDHGRGRSLRPLGIDRLAVWKISGGGSHAIASAALLPDLVASVGVLASLVPWGAEGLSYFSGMGELNVENIAQMLEDPVAARARCERDRVEMLTQTLPEMMEFLKTLLAPVDAAALTGELGQYLIDATRSGMGTSSDGWWDDGLNDARAVGVQARRDPDCGPATPWPA